MNGKQIEFGDALDNMEALSSENKVRSD